MSMKQELTMIVAASKNNVIGNKGDIPWYIPEDLKRFKELTMNHPVIMGRRTYFSIPEKFRPLKGRRNIVLSRLMKKQPGFYVAKNIEEALMFAGGKNSFVIGGEEVYKLFLPDIDRIELTRVHKNFQGDAFLPDINWGDFYLSTCKESESKEGLEYSFLSYRRKH
jgi:dihydrofolate reductase